MKVFLFLALIPACLAQSAGPRITTLYRLGNNPDAHNPRTGLIRDSHGTFYGTTYWGGSSKNCPDGCGSVYQFTPPAAGAGWKETVIHDFAGGVDGARPEGGLVIDNTTGALYGTTSIGGSSNNGTVYQLIPPAAPGGPWTKTTVYNFAGAPDGTLPWAGLTSNAGGGFYGTTQFGGSGTACKTGCGTVYQLTPPTAPGGAWTETVLYSFTNGKRDGANPIGGVIVSSTGALYGTTSSGNLSKNCPFGCGKVFELTPPSAAGGAWTEALIHSFSYADGSRPWTALTPGSNGVLYGTTNNGGSSTACQHGCGTIFQLTPPAAPGGRWTETVLHSLGGNGDGGDGAQPWGSLTLGANGVLYGSTLNGGAGTCNYPGSPGCGSLYQLAPPSAPGGAWTETVLYSYTGGRDGADPMGTLLLGANGELYGTTSVGGKANRGTIFVLKP